jgi:hypothetical protein
MNDGPKIKFVDFWIGFDPCRNPLYDVLAKRFGAVICDNPDYLIYSVFGGEHLFNRKYERCIKIMWTGESVRADFKNCDYALSFDYSDDPRNLRWPLYAQGASALVRPSEIVVETIASSKTLFCNFLYSNGNCSTRNEFFRLLSEYKRVDSGGDVLNNLGFRVGDKREFQSRYKFTIAFENSSYPGYVTEKISDPLSVYSVPIYWGSPRIDEDFDSGCFVNCHEYDSFREVVDRVVSIDEDEDLYRSYLRSPCFPGNVLPTCCREEYLLSFFTNVFADKLPRCHERPNPAEVVSQPGGWSVPA